MRRVSVTAVALVFVGSSALAQRDGGSQTQPVPLTFGETFTIQS